MGKRANPLLVGSFVLGGLALAVTVIATIGSGKFFRHTQRFVVYFDGSVNGLDKGAPVKFRGVPIGTVTDVRLKLPPQPADEQRIPALVEIDEDHGREPRRELAVGLGPITFPPCLDRSELVSRVGTNELRPSPFDFWTGPLNEQFKSG